MPEYVLNPYVHLIESHLDPGDLRYAFFHQVTGDVFELPADLREVLLSTRAGKQIVIDPLDMASKGLAGQLILQLINSQFLIEAKSDPIEGLLDYSVVRPIQNPALFYPSQNGDLVVVRLSMANRLCSPLPGQTPAVVEELLPAPAATVVLNADGSATLREVFNSCQIAVPKGNALVEFLTNPERQLIKLAPPNADLDDPNQTFNAVPRNLYHSARWQSSESTSPSAEFHTMGIEDAEWEFDLIEPTVNHAFRFPSTALGGLDYGARFSEATFANQSQIVQAESAFNILEVGAGVGTFARSFMRHASTVLDSGGANLSYHILELSPVLAASQKKLLSEAGTNVEHYQQDAISFDIPDRKFDLIIANEVAADFPVAAVELQPANESDKDPLRVGEGVTYLARYGLPGEQVEQSFRVNAGAFEFVERAWQHLNPGGRVIMSEYGAVDLLPVQILHLNHDEFSIHFGHLKTCAEKVGFTCELLSLAEFLQIEEQVLMLAGNDEHIICLNHVLSRFGLRVPYAALTKSDFDAQFGSALEKMEVTGPRFLPLSRGFYFGPRIDEFMVLIMSKP